ncbi:hypothetical protein EYZ11_010196 [Aspergillus tanneri]|uniref:Uncharacterized protein n=1 Tax=Aspergillus tanneri TaxID=1220188 RepID=A0A4S3J5Y3_9EURO|nr:hypothetical protein EYZ11_010196 [Aspergillus tanneri]
MAKDNTSPITNIAVRDESTEGHVYGRSVERRRKEDHERLDGLNVIVNALCAARGLTESPKSKYKKVPAFRPNDLAKMVRCDEKEQHDK